MKILDGSMIFGFKGFHTLVHIFPDVHIKEIDICDMIIFHSDKKASREIRLVYPQDTFIEFLHRQPDNILY